MRVAELRLGGTAADRGDRIAVARGRDVSRASWRGAALPARRPIRRARRAALGTDRRAAGARRPGPNDSRRTARERRTTSAHRIGALYDPAGRGRAAHGVPAPMTGGPKKKPEV